MGPVQTRARRAATAGTQARAKMPGSELLSSYRDAVKGTASKISFAKWSPTKIGVDFGRMGARSTS